MTTPAAARKWFGAVVAALTLTLVASVAPASAAPGDNGKTETTKNVSAQKRDSGWDKP